MSSVLRAIKGHHSQNVVPLPRPVKFFRVLDVPFSVDLKRLIWSNDFVATNVAKVGRTVTICSSNLDDFIVEPSFIDINRVAALREFWSKFVHVHNVHVHCPHDLFVGAAGFGGHVDFEASVFLAVDASTQNEFRTRARLARRGSGTVSGTGSGSGQSL